MKARGRVLGTLMAAGVVTLVAMSTTPATALDAAPSTVANQPVFGWSTNTLAQTRAAEATLGMTAGALGTFADFTTPFPAAWAKAAERRDVPLVIAWEPWDWSAAPGDQPRYALDRIADGSFDAYAHRWARAAAPYGSRIIVRFAPEMNGDWQVWNKGDRPADFIRAWRHLHDLFAKADAGSIQWAFVPISTWVGGPAYRSWWPGKSYVDWLGVDGYQWVGVLPRRVYVSARTVFERSVRELRGLDSDLPLMIPETAAGAPYKATWVSDLARTAPALGVSMVLWFEHDKETDWRLTSHTWTVRVKDTLASSGWTVS